MNSTAKIVLISIGASLASAALASAITILYFKSARQSAPVSVPTAAESKRTPQNEGAKPVEEKPEAAKPAEPATAVLLPDQLIQDPGVVWLPVPRKLAEELKLFYMFEYDDENLPPPLRKSTPVFDEGITYYKTGMDNGNDIILATIPPEGPGEDFAVYLLRTASGSYEYIAQNSDAYDPESKEFYGAQPIESVKINYEKVYRSILKQDVLAYQGVNLENFGGFIAIDTPPQSRIEVAKTPYGILYSEARPGEVEDLLVESFVLVKPNGLEETYQYIPEGMLGDDGVADVTWNTGKRNTDTFQLVNTTGCGAGAFLALVAPSVTSRLV
ncbi:hypothetical protein HYV71_03285, partial [Candidatus Uhrbacteria bacterium]|nr:hypothetical protein [Candidatus Uhrbacteria bacterium]